MSAPSISIARVVGQRIFIAWQEAVAVATRAEQLSIERGVHLDLDRCLISSDGEIRLATSAPRDPETSLSALGLLAILLEGQSAPAPLRSLIAGDEALAEFPSEQVQVGTTCHELSWFLSPAPEQEVARLAARSLAHAEAQTIREDLQGAEAERRAARNRGSGVTMRIARMSPGVAAGILLTATVGALGAVTVGLLAGAPLPSRAARGAAAAISTSDRDDATDEGRTRRLAVPAVRDQEREGR
jgi:hypothetical protein